MAKTTTTLSGAVVIDQNTIGVVSAIGFAANSIVRIDQEVLQVQSSYITGLTIPVLRGREGTATQAHATAANVTVGLASDFDAPGPQATTTFPIAAFPRTLISYSAAGAIALPTAGTDLVVVLNGTGVLAMTLAVPPKDLDGSIVYVIGNGKAAHTITASGGFGANTTNSDVMTFHATQAQAFQFMAANGVWNLLGHVAGAASVAGTGLA